jgi:hypothetical protein
MKIYEKLDPKSPLTLSEELISIADKFDVNTGERLIGSISKENFRRLETFLGVRAQYIKGFDEEVGLKLTGTSPVIFVPERNLNDTACIIKLYRNEKI